MFKFFSKKKIDPSKELKKVLGQYSLPTFSGTVIEVLHRIRSPKSTTCDR